MMDELPPQGVEDMGQDGMGDDVPPQQGGMMLPPEGQSEFDTNFDAGVEADEEADPKRYIQQLTGKLSQSLRSYNQGLPQPDAELDKYVAGMIVKQAVEGLSAEDRGEILSKVESDEGEEDGQAPVQNDVEMTGEQPQMPTQGEQQGQMPMNSNESVAKWDRNKIDEVFGNILRGDNDDEDKAAPVNQKIGYKGKAYTAKNFK